MADTKVFSFPDNGNNGGGLFGGSGGVAARIYRENDNQGDCQIGSRFFLCAKTIKSQTEGE